jgi:hypothetical protein
LAGTIDYAPDNHDRQEGDDGEAGPAKRGHHNTPRPDVNDLVERFMIWQRSTCPF